jgi:multidrug efflux pump subunit AcrA (membrane-fusion protein)
MATAALSRGERVAVELARPKRAPLVVPVLCLGTLQPPPGGVLHAPGGGLVAAIFVAEGARVEKGAPLMRLDDAGLAEKAAAAREELQRLREARAVAEAEHLGAEREVAYHKEALEADSRLLDKGAIPRSVYDSHALALQQAEAKWRSTEARLESLGAPSAGEGSRLAAAAARARDLESRVAALTVRAPFAGAVYGLPARVGIAVAEGDVAANVADPEEPRIELRVDPPDLPQVAAGQRLVVTFDGLPDRQWEGRVNAVAPALADASGREVGRVTGAIADPERRLPFNAAVSARIVVGEMASALLVPRACLHRQGDRRFVYVEQDGRAARREVRVGLVGLNEVEIKEGLTEGEPVVLPGEVPLRQGLRIAARAP